jgi:hypothetical protein
LKVINSEGIKVSFDIETQSRTNVIKVYAKKKNMKCLDEITVALKAFIDEAIT